MGRNRIGLQVKGFDEYMAKLDKIGGSDAMKRGVESALKASKQYVNPQIDSALANLQLEVDTLMVVQRRLLIKT